MAAQADFTALQLFGQAHAIGDGACVGLLGQRQQLVNILLELFFKLDNVVMRQGTMARRIGCDLGAIQTHGAHAQRFHLVGHLQHLDKQIGQIVKESAAKGARVSWSGWVPVAKGDRVVGGSLDLAAREHACGLAID